MPIHSESSIAQTEEDATPLSRVAYLDAGKYVVDTYADMVQLRKTESFAGTPTGGGARGAITTFSRASRRRMFKWLAKVRNPDRLHFITLTYRDDEWFGDDLSPRDFQSHLIAFYKRVEREYDGVGILWRKELKSRKSGDYEGMIAPHAHCIIRNIPDDLDDFRDFVRDAWSEIVGSAARGDYTRTDVQIARSRRKMACYLSKYTAKMTEDDDIQNVNAYLSEHTTQWGRHWGYRGEWDTSLGDEVPVTGDEIIEFKRLVRRWLKSQGKRKLAKSFARIRFDYGMFVLGLGDESGVDGTLLRQILQHSRSLANSPP